jgi:phenylacetate-CoA ligase
MSGEHFDSLETRDAGQREADLMARLSGQVAQAMANAPAWAEHLKGVDAGGVTSREALAQLPVLRKSDLKSLQEAAPPFGGFATCAPGDAVRLFMSPGPIYEPQDDGDDPWSGARAMFAAGMRKGDVVHNSLSYHLTPGGFIMDSSARALGCSVIPGGVGNTELQLDLIEMFKPVAYTGTPDFLKVLLDKAEELGRDASSIVKGLVGGAALPESLRTELKGRGLSVYQSYATADVGMIAYETPALEGMVVDENAIVEIVRPGSGDPVPEGDVGEVVVTSFNKAYPMIRLATGDLSAVLPGSSPCGRTNMRIRGWMGRADQRTKVKGMFIDPAQIGEIAERHSGLGRLRLVVGRENEQDVMVLRVESASQDDGLREALAATVQSICKVRGSVDLVPMGDLPNDGKVISDERDYS